MSMSNAEIIKRADLALTDLATNGGLLNPEQANQFIDFIIDQPTIVRQARSVRMNAPTRKINRLGFSSRIMRAATQAGGFNDDGSNDRHLLEADRSKPETTQIELNTKEVIAEVHLPYETLEDNIERDNFDEHVMRLIAERAALDIEEWVIQGDTGSGDAYLAQHDGLIVGATSNVSDNASAGISASMFEASLIAMPQKYHRLLSQMRFYTTIQDVIRYRGKLAVRETGLGDTSISQNNQLTAFGVPVEGVALMPANTGLLTFPSNILVGIQRQVMVEVDRDIRAREWIIVLTMRLDSIYDEEPAVVKITNI